LEVRFSVLAALAVESEVVAKRYNQYCPVAHALDLVGERWSLLVVRELAHGPLRYTDLHARLGCGTNVLAQRLRELETGGVVARRKLPPPAASTVYELTASGEGLRPVLHTLAWWGVRTLGPPPDDIEFEPGWLTGALQTALWSVPGDDVVEFRIGDEVASFRAGGVHEGPSAEPDAVVVADPRGLFHLLVDGDATGVEVEGDAGAVERLLAALPGAAQTAAPSGA
jgi:DNA-binding HxlR family transcriptional regulator